MEEGYIKFSLFLKKGSPPKEAEIADILEARQRLYDWNFIGALPSGIGFGNISKRFNGNQCYISGSATGGIEKLESKHFSTIMDYSIKDNKIECSGELSASSESLTHLAIYEINDKIKYIAHIHNSVIWAFLLKTNQATENYFNYGTPEIAMNAAEFCKKQNLSTGCFAMRGHEDGVIFYSDEMKKLMELIEITKEGISE